VSEDNTNNNTKDWTDKWKNCGFFIGLNNHISLRLRFTTICISAGDKVGLIYEKTTTVT